MGILRVGVWGALCVLASCGRIGFGPVAEDAATDAAIDSDSASDSNARGINADQRDNSASNSGAAYVFLRTGTTWSQQAYLKASNADAGDAFGVNVGLSSELIVIGANGEDSSAATIDRGPADNRAASSGAAYLFRRAAGTWTQEAYLKASNSDPGDFFGARVAASNGTVAIAARFEGSNATGIDGDQADNSAPASGAVYLFRQVAGAWSQEAYLKASNTRATDDFGTSVALIGDTLAVGAQAEDSDAVGVDGDQANRGAIDSGAVYLYRRTGTSWSQENYIKASNTEAGDQFGFSVALSELTLAIGARLEDGDAVGLDGDLASNGASDSGAVYLF